MDIDENAPGNKSQQPETRTTDNETGHDPNRNQSEVLLPSDDESPVDEDMADVAATNSVSSEHPEAGTNGHADDPDADPQLNDQDDVKEARGVPASDPESGA
ncbi:hypothetical protein PS918_03114 [Pseudomonas fluorescens]|uniref:Uncharacterized protein n=1 Tax=Pseudomonas fluorescens TaxID=294 RepID=A0A5E7T230_PSEFL|nr:hypothetical protein [Pseudomonas fluorescens]VVP89723.1 hypothetical protein PS918_03114 [Pseudomonas fluorescens]